MTVRNKALIVFVGSIALAGAAEGAPAQRPVSDRTAKSAGVVTATWTGPDTGGSWSDHTNWSTSPNFPSNGNGGVDYEVTIISDIGNPKVIGLDTAVEIEALFLRGTLNTLSDSANLIINGLFDWQGQLLGPGTTTANGGIIDTTLSIQVGLGGGHILDNAGLATLRSGIIVDNGAQLNNLASGTLNLQGAIGTTNDGEVNNFGLLYSQSGPSIDGVFNNHGSLEVRSGGLRLQSTGTHGGTFDAAEFTSLIFAPGNGVNDFAATSAISGPGDVIFGQSFGAEIYNIDGTFELTGKVTAGLSTVNFMSLPTSTGFSLEISNSSLVNFALGVPSLSDLLLSSGTFHVNGDATIAGPVRWDGTMSGPGTTTTDGLVRAVTGLTLDGRTLIANGGLRWQGSDFLLDNDAVFHNAKGSTFNIDLIRSRFINTNTPANPGRIVNAGITSQADGPPATIMIDWMQTSTGVMNADDLSFFGNTDVSGTVTVPAGFRNAITFAGPDTGATISHWLNSDSSLIAMGTVQVGDPNASGSDIINAEFAGTVEFSGSSSRLVVSGANTTLTLPGRTSSGSTSARGGETLSVTALEMKKSLIAFYDPFIACCMPDGTCVDMPTHICALGVKGGILTRPGSHCGDATCGSGACCFDDNSCSILQEPGASNDCANAGGRYAGHFTTCENCNTGACCVNDRCTVIPESDCAQIGGLFLGRGSNCYDDKACGFAFLHQSSIGSLVVDAGSLLVISPSTFVASSISVGSLFANGDCNFEGIGAATASMTVDRGFYNNFGATCTQNNLDQTITGSAELGFGVTVDLVKAAKFALDGQGQPVPGSVFFGQGFEINSPDQTGSLDIHLFTGRFSETTDPTNPSQQFHVPVTAEDSDWTASCPNCPGRPNVLFDAGLTFGGNCSVEHIDATVQPVLTIAPDAEWSLNDCNIQTEMFDDAGSKSISIKDSTVAIELLDPHRSVAFGDVLSLSNSEVRIVDADGTSELGHLSGTITLDQGPLNEPPSGTLIIELTDSMSTATIPTGTIIAPGDSKGTPGEIGTATLSFDEVVLEPGSVLEVDIDSEDNDLLQINADITTYDASLACTTHFDTCSLIPSDKTWFIVSGNAISYPSGGDGRRILTKNGEGTVVVNQSPTGIVLSDFALAGDGNGDASVNNTDTQAFVPCVTGPGVEVVIPGCVPYDFNGDRFADLRDFSTIQKRFGTTCP